jgi:hypothetical protein
MNSSLLLKDLVLDCPELCLQVLFFLGEGTFHLHEVFVELILGEDIAADSLVKTVDLDLLVHEVAIFALDKFEALLELKLEEGVLVSC